MSENQKNSPTSWLDRWLEILKGAFEKVKLMGSARTEPEPPQSTSGPEAQPAATTAPNNVVKANFAEKERQRREGAQTREGESTPPPLITKPWDPKDYLKAPANENGPQQHVRQ